MPWDRFINCTQFRTRFHLLSKAPQHLLSFKTNHNQPTRHCQPQLPHQLYHITQHTNTNLRFHALPIQESKQNAHKTHKPMPHNPKPPNPYSHTATARARVCAFVCVFLWDRVFVCVCARVFLWDRVCVCVCVCVCVSIESMCSWSWLRALVKAMSAQEAWTVFDYLFLLHSFRKTMSLHFLGTYSSCTYLVSIF